MKDFYIDSDFVSLYICHKCKIIYMIYRMLHTVDYIDCACSEDCFNVYRLYLGNNPSLKNTKDNPTFKAIKKTYPDYVFFKRQSPTVMYMSERMKYALLKLKKSITKIKNVIIYKKEK